MYGNRMEGMGRGGESRGEEGKEEEEEPVPALFWGAIALSPASSAQL